jgi:hypothetical protein
VLPGTALDPPCAAAAARREVTRRSDGGVASGARRSYALPMDAAAPLREAVASWEGVVEAKSKFGGRGLAFHVDGREFLHFHSRTLIDVRMTRARIRDLPSSVRVQCRFRPTASDWVEIRLRDVADGVFAGSAAHTAWQDARTAKRPKAGATKKRRR